MINLRKLDMKDAPFMFEWMHDDFIVHNLQTDFTEKTIEDCYLFIESARNSLVDYHMAVVSDSDEYMGTVSLKHISCDIAEFAIVIRSSAMGKGFSKYAMERMLDEGFYKLNISSIYWCVSPENKRAVRFYDKNGYNRVSPDQLAIRGGTAKQRYRHIIGISFAKKIGGEEKTIKYECFFPPKNKVDRRKSA